MAVDIAIIMGSSYTLIFLSEEGVVLKEPTIAAFKADSKKLCAAGGAALNMVGRTPDSTVLVAPVRNGLIVEPSVAAQLLKEFVARVTPAKGLLKFRINAIMAVPTGISKQDCQVYYDVCAAAGISSVTLVPKIMLAAVGMGLPVSSPISSMVVSMGAGISDIAVIALSGILSSGAWGITIGGDMMDGAICDYLVGKYNLKISLVAAAKLKEEIGSLYENDIAVKEVRGIDMNEKMPASVRVTAADLREVLAPYYLRIGEVVETAMNGCGPDVSADIARSGIFFTGGAAKIPGLSELLTPVLKLKITVADEPELAAIIGGGKLLKNKELLKDIVS